MKKLFATLAVLAIALSADAGQYVRVITNRVMLLPPATMGEATTKWTTNTAYLRGAIVHNTNSFINYLCLDAGTSATSGQGPGGLGEVTDGTVSWFSCIKGDVRRLWLAQVIAGGDLTLQMDGSTTNTDGLVVKYGQTLGQDGVNTILSEHSGSILDPGSVWQGAIYGVSTGATVTVTEW